MASAFITKTRKGLYSLDFETDKKEHYQFMQEMARKCVDEKISETEQKWIPVTERLPEEEGRYLCVLPIGKSGAVYVQMMNGDRYGFSLAHIYNDDVTHWMPLPQPPKEGEK